MAVETPYTRPMKFKLAPSPTTAPSPQGASESPTPPTTPPAEGLGLLDVRRLPLADLNPAPYNPRTMTEKARMGLHNSIEQFGLVEPIIWNKRTGYIVGGHQRYSELKERGVSETDVVVVDLDPTKEIALNITLNNKNIQGDWLDQQRDELISQLQNEDEKLAKDLQLLELKLPEWEPLEEVKDEGLKNNNHDKVIKITIMPGHEYLFDEILDNVKSLIQNHYEEGTVKIDAK